MYTGFLIENIITIALLTTITIILAARFIHQAIWVSKHELINYGINRPSSSMKSLVLR